MKNDYIQSGITEEEFCAMDEYLKSLGLNSKITLAKSIEPFEMLRPLR